MKELYHNSKLSPVELAKHLKTIKTLADTRSDFERIKDDILPKATNERISKILAGLEQEDEFAILCRLMQTCTSVAKLDQTPIVEHCDDIVPDFLVSFNPGCSTVGKDRTELKITYNCFVEVKSCHQKKFKITQNDLSKRRNYARRFGIPLVFAIRFTEFGNHSLWILIEAEYLREKGGKVEPIDMASHLNHILFDDYFIMPMPGLHIAHYYDADNNSGPTHKKYGTLTKTVLLYPDHYIDIDERVHLLISAALESFDLEVVQTVADKNKTCVVSIFSNQARMLSDLLYRVNHLAYDNDGRPVFDASKAVAMLDSTEKKPALITREMIEYAFGVCNAQHLLFGRLGFEKPDDQLRKLRKLGRGTGK